MRAEIISIGTELLLGEIVDTNAAWLAQQLAAIGVDVYFRTTVGDNVERIAHVIRLALSRSEVVITSGGLGPTVDDMTREGIAQAVGAPLVLDETLLAQVRARFVKIGRAMSSNNVRQAYIPRGATGIENPVGTAPVFLVEQDDKFIFTLPGVPGEMKYLTETRLLPWLRDQLGGDSIILSKILRTCAIGESQIDEKIGDLETETNPTVGLAAHPGQTDIRITAKAKTRAEAAELIKAMEARVRERVGDYIYGVNDETLEQVVARLIAAKGLRVGIAESNTRGRIAERLRTTPEQLRIESRGLEIAESEQITEEHARAIAADLRQQAKVDLALAVVGTMGADEDVYGRQGKTVIAIAADGRTRSAAHAIGGMGDLAQSWIYYRALDLLRRALI